MSGQPNDVTKVNNEKRSEAKFIVLKAIKQSGKQNYLGFGDDFDSNRLPFELALPSLSIAGVAKMAAADLVPQFILRSKILTVTKTLIQRPFTLCPVLRYGTILWLLRRPLPLNERGLDVFSGRRRGKRAAEKPSGS